MIRKTRGIVLHTTRYGESSLVVHVYTVEWGRQSYMIKGVRKSKRDNRSSLFQPLYILDFEVYHKDTRELQLVKEVVRAFPVNSIPFDITKSTQAIFMAEVLYRVVKEEEPNPMLSRFLINTIQYLDALENPQPDFHITFLFHLTRYLGFYPRNNHSAENPYFNLVSGFFTSVPGEPGNFLDEQTSGLWSRYLESDFKIQNGLIFNSSQRKSVLNSLVRYYKSHVDGMGEIRSLEVLHDLFH